MMMPSPSTFVVLFSCVVSALFLHLSEAFPHGGATCASDWDCSLGGVCNITSSQCQCDPWFTGTNCSYLNLAHAQTDQYGFQVPTYYSWGGHCAYNASSKRYVAFFAFMQNHCTLSTWTTNSAIVMTTADKPEGPYDATNYQIIDEPWAHNPYLSRNTVNGKDWLLWHIGDGTSVNPPVNCTVGDVDDFKMKSDSQHVTNTNLFVDTSLQSVNGPWESEWDILMNEAWVAAVSNPAPYIFPNGTVLLYFSTENCPPNWGLAPRCLSMAVSHNSWKGPYSVIGAEPIVRPESEDPAVWRDIRGNFHLLSNVNTHHKRCAANVPCGGHAWSADGISWSEQFIGAFGPIIHFANGSTWTNAYVERPQVYQESDESAPITFFVGMGRHSYYDSISWAQPFCNQKLLDEGLCDPSIPL